MPAETRIRSVRPQSRLPSTIVISHGGPKTRLAWALARSGGARRARAATPRPRRPATAMFRSAAVDDDAEQLGRCGRADRSAAGARPAKPFAGLRPA
jgi:hypothetical protein